MTISDQPYQVSTRRPSSSTPNSAPLSSPGREVNTFTINGPFLRKAPTDHRDDRGELDVEAITLAWLGWRRLEWNGADLGAAHTVEAGYSRGAMFRPGGGRCRVELEDRAGRHVPPWERYYHVIVKACTLLDWIGVLG